MLYGFSPSWLALIVVSTVLGLGDAVLHQLDVSQVECRCR